MAEENRPPAVKIVSSREVGDGRFWREGCWDGGMEAKKLTDDQLWNELREIAQKDRKITVRLLEHLHEVELRRLHFDRGYASLYEYLVHELKYSEGSAYRRLQALKLLKAVPSSKEGLESGQLSLNTAVKIQTTQSTATPAEKEAWIEKLKGKPAREVDRELADGKTEGRERTRWLSPDRCELTLLLEKKPFEGLTQLKAARSHTEGAKSYGGIVTDLIELGQSRWNPSRLGAPSQRVSGATKTLTAKTRRLIWQRDGGRCTYVDPATGRRCESTHYLQIDHIQPLALGGSHAPENLRLLCGQHNRRRAEKTFGPRPSAPHAPLN